MNPRFWLYFKALDRPFPGTGLAKLILRLEGDLETYALLYPDLPDLNLQPVVEPCSPAEFCGLMQLYTGLPLVVGTEQTAIYQALTHQKVLSLEFRLPECYLLLDYEDLSIKKDLSDQVSDQLRNFIILNEEN